MLLESSAGFARIHALAIACDFVLFQRDARVFALRTLEIAERQRSKSWLVRLG
jgi:hypothetical protein